MVVTSVGRPRFKYFFVGLLCVIFALVLVLSLYSYTLGVTSHGLTILESSQVAPLFLGITAIVLLGVYGGYEIGRYAEAQNKKAT